MLFCPSSDQVQCKKVEEVDECEWAILHSNTEGMDGAIASSPAPAPNLDDGQQSGDPSLSPDGATYAASSTLLFSVPEVTTHSFDISQGFVLFFNLHFFKKNLIKLVFGVLTL